MKIRNVLYAMLSGVLLLIPSFVSADDPISYTESSTLCYMDTSNASYEVKKSGKQTYLNEVYIFYSNATEDTMDGWYFVHQSAISKSSSVGVMWGHADKYPDDMLVDGTYAGKLTEDFYLKFPRDPLAGVLIGEGYLEGVTVTYQADLMAEGEEYCPDDPPIQCGEGGGYTCTAPFFDQVRVYTGEITGYPED